MRAPEPRAFLVLLDHALDELQVLMDAGGLSATLLEGLGPV
ncbi:MAG: hypothetical protein QOK49_420, partial [Baekduia sp.]|nr:hypothetical protein [Baekduia sp.]